MQIFRTIRSAVHTRAVIGLAVALLALGAAACQAEDRPTVIGQGQEADLGSLEEQDGTEVTLRGEVTEVVSPSVFFLRTDQADDGDILVLAGSEAAVTMGQTVQVTGAVRHIASGFAEDTGLDPGQEGLYEAVGLDNEQDFVSAYEGDTSIVADSVDVLDPA